MKLTIGLMLGICIGISIMQYSNTLSRDQEILQKTQECIKAGGTEYLYWNGTCQKVIQERKTEIILITN